MPKSPAWAPDQYVLASSLGFVNDDVSLHVYGPTTLDAAITHARALAHRPVAAHADAVMTTMTCSKCRLSLSDMIAPHFFGRMLDEQCTGRPV